MQKPKPHSGLRHIALNVQHLAESVRFYTDILGFKIIWQPDEENIYLTSGTDNLALHVTKKEFTSNTAQHLDHLGFFLQLPQDVDAWFEYMKTAGVSIKAAPKDHRDGTRSFYCADPDGNIIQMIYYPLTEDKQ